MIDKLGPYAKALVLLALIIVAGVAEAIGLEVGLDAEHYVMLLVADFLIWFVPNKDLE